MERMPPKKLLFIIFIFSTISLLRLFSNTSKTSTSIQLPTLPTFPNTCSPTDPTAAEHLPLISNTLTRYTASHADDSLTPKEHQLLSNVISHIVPCNLLFFGLKPQFVSLSKLNAEGITVFLEDDAEKLRWIAPKLKGVRIHKVKYHVKASKAYELLKHARVDQACRNAASPLHESHCKLALTRLPWDVYQTKWDVVVVDGPSGDHPETSGRMGVIYTAAIFARAGNTTDVLVHDVDRIIEKWYSWEFLCHENLVSSKGKLWHFRIKGNSNSARFCRHYNSD